MSQDLQEKLNSLLSIERKICAEKALYAFLNGKAYPFLKFQPQFSFHNESICGAESLIRLFSSQYGEISPSDFIPLAEKQFCICHIGTWVLKESCLAARRWQKAGFNIPVSVNISVQQLTRSDFVLEVSKALEESKIPPSSLKLEITESMLIGEKPKSILKELSEMGVLLSIDDFGAGFSGFAHIKNIPAAEIKIDRAFIKNMDDRGLVIVKHIVELARDLGMKVVVEGVETATQYELLKRIGCDMGQGYFFACPMREELLMNFLQES